jgi:hypothetical protein
MIDGKERKLGPGETIGIARGIPHKMWNSDGETAVALWRTRPAGRTADWFATIDRLGAGGTKSPSLPALAKAVTRHSDVFRLAVVPLALRPVVQIGLRVLALADR